MNRTQTILGKQLDIEKINNTIAHLEKYGSARTEDLLYIKEYIKILDSKMKTLSFIALDFQQEGNKKAYEKTIDEIGVLLNEKDRVNVKTYVKNYRSAYVDLESLHGTFTHPFFMEHTGYSNNPFYDFLDLVKELNSYYDIAEPNKAPNKVAYGWNKAYEKTHSEKYLYACIRNYLQDNDADFTTKDLQSIVFGQF